MREVDLHNLARLGAVNSASVRSQFGGYVLQIETCVGVESLTLQRGGERVFKTLDAAASVIFSIGLERFDVVASKPIEHQVEWNRGEVAEPCAEGPRLRGDCTGAATGMPAREKAKADPKRAAARAKRKKRR